MLNSNYPDRVRMRQLCSLAAVGEISLEDRVVLHKHLGVCEECRTWLKDLEQLTLCDLSAAAAARAENFGSEDLEPEVEDRLLDGLLEKTRQLQIEEHTGLPSNVAIVRACPVPFWTRLKRSCALLIPVSGFALALLVAVGSWAFIAKHSEPSESRLLPASPNPSVQAEINKWKVRALTAEQQIGNLQRDRATSQAQAQSDSKSLAQLADDNQRIHAQEQQLETRVAQQDSKLRQDENQFALNQSRLEDALGDAATERAQLQEVNGVLENQRSEVAHWREVAATTPARLPVTGNQIGDKEVQSILGARDLHIVDVFDVDRTGHSSKIYGRVYYVDRRVLLFYAFDLDQGERARRPVAFQAWGFRQPNSSTAESLGLFYLEDPKLDRWTLRVSDPHLLEHIDTLFVTVEPPGGSKMPRGRHLLFASLGGPPNHP